MGLLGSFLKGFSSDTIKDTFKKFEQLRESYVEDMGLMASYIESMRVNQLGERAKADEALNAARQKQQESLIKKKIAEEKKSAKYMAQMNQLEKITKTGMIDPGFLSRYSGLNRRKTLIGKK